MLQLEIASLKYGMKSLETVVGEKVNSGRRALKLLERLVFASMAVSLLEKRIGRYF